MVDSMLVQKDLILQKSVTPVHNGIGTHLRVEFEEEEKINQRVKSTKATNTSPYKHQHTRDLIDQQI